MQPHDSIVITVVFCAPNVEDVTEVQLPPRSTVRDAIESAGVLSRHPELKSQQPELDVGIWGRRCALDDPVTNRDRVEIYRPLASDPKEARRARVEQRRKSRAEQR